MTSMPGPDSRRLEELREDAAHRRRRVDLYRAKSYGPRLTSPARLRELEREADAAEARLAAAISRGRQPRA
ncbi:MAG: hypothetical protein ACR2KV_11955 [Solirubrobacteraceae bacterium]